MATEVVTKGIIGPTGPATIAVGSVITARGRLAVGNSVGTPVALAPGAVGTYLRSNGTDPVYAVIPAGDLPTGIDAAKLADGTISNAELQFINSLTSNAQTQLNAKAAIAHNHLLNTERGIFFDQFSASSASPVDNTTATATYAQAANYALTLPTGTWYVRAQGGVALRHSTGGSVQFRVSIENQDTGARTLGDTSTTIYQQGVDDDDLSGLSGAINIYVHFRCVTAGTVFARNPWLSIRAERTA